MNIFVNYSITKEKVFQETSIDLFWYDSIKKELMKFKGTHLRFENKEDPFLVEMGEKERIKRGITSTYRVLPEVKNIEFFKIENKIDKKKLKDFFKNYLNYENSDIEINYEDKEGISFNVPEKEIDDFIHQLERNRFNYYKE